MPDQPTATSRTSNGRNSLVSLGAAAGMLAFAMAFFALAMAGSDDDDGSTAAVATSANVSLAEFSIAPDPIEIGAGGTVHLTNDGAVAHNFSVEGTELVTPDIAGGESAELALGDLAPGEYTVSCLIPGHADAGMRATMNVSEGGGVASGETPASTGGHDMDSMDYAAMTEDMIASMAEFPAATEGTGNAVLEPTEILADGTKVFDLVAAITPWERAPGDVVDAWTYNGMVPGPTIQLAIGERAQIRLENGLPIATDLHMHGLNLDNEFDGVAPITQDVIEPGDTFTYEYVADEVAVAMYHPHFHSQVGMPNGMFGAILVGQVPIPRGTVIGDEVIPADLVIAQEFPMVLNDSGVIGFSLNGKSFPATAPVVANTGDWVLFHYYNEGSLIHPMHLHSFDQIVLARDGYPLDSPYVADVVNVAPGERYSVLVQLDRPGAWVWHCHILPHVEDVNGMFGMVTAVVVQ